MFALSQFAVQVLKCLEISIHQTNLVRSTLRVSAVLEYRQGRRSVLHLAELPCVNSLLALKLCEE